ncbi:MAG: thioredoxin-disulfide reductase [Candidatus Omnitrophica bacterium]|nr:thioredoxin-disulfide reductase [Candidatus Omnitrophota bacterium]
MEGIYDIVIIGGGPAGLTAGIYASRARMKTLLLERMACGGQLLTADIVENFPGFPCGTTGAQLADLMLKQAQGFGLEISTREAKKISLKKNAKDPFIIEADEDDSVKALSIIIAAGAGWNSLGVPGEDKLKGRGVSYCATCDGPLFKGKEVVVVGGGDTALSDAIFLTKFADKVTVVHRRFMLRATQILQERALANKKIAFCLKSVVTEIIGTNKVEGIKVKDAATSAEKTIKADGVFVLIGLLPNSGICKGIVKLDEKGYIISDEDMRTSMDGIFVCGDVRQKPLRQVVTAAGEGATAAVSAEHYVEKIKGIEYPRRTH